MGMKSHRHSQIVVIIVKRKKSLSMKKGKIEREKTLVRRKSNVM